MTAYTPEFLISAAKAWMRADAHRMAERPRGYTKSAWRSEHPIDLPKSFQVMDTAFRTRPKRVLWFDCAGNPYDLWVWSTGKAPRVIERIDLKRDDAAGRLARYICA